jgi:glycosyltransferase involved in cell wall biosynthesis
MSSRPFVYNIRDLYPDMAVGGEIVNSGFWVDRWEKMHRRALRQAARVVVLGDDMRDRIIDKGVAPERVVIVRDGSWFPSSLPERSDPVVQKIRSGFSFVAIHAGNLGFYGAWNTLLKAAEILRNENIGLVFVGDGANRATLEASAQSSPNVRFLPFFPVRRGLEGVVVPSKLYSILAFGRPVLAVAPATTDAARIVTETGCGRSADPDDPAAVAATLVQLRKDPARLAQMGARAREVAAKYARVNELDRFVNVMEEVGNHSNV